MGTAVIGAPGFRASSGRTVRVGDDGTVMFDHANGYLSPASAMDAEEFFRAKRDEELGRWRWPENPDWIAIEQPARTPEGRTVKVVDERTLDYFHANERVMTTDAGSSAHRAARAYFEAHPERKPWHDAQPGEFWNVCHADTAEMCRVDDVSGALRFTGVDAGDMHVTMPIAHPSISHAVRFIAEDAS